MPYSNKNKMNLELSKIELKDYLTAVPTSTQGMEWEILELNNAKVTNTQAQSNVQDVIKIANNFSEEDKTNNTNEITNINNKNNKM